MNIDILTVLEASGGIISGAGSLWVGWRHIRYSAQAKKDRERQDILDKANEELGRVKRELESKIGSLKQEFENHKSNLVKDLDFMRSTYNAEIKVLGEKIESLREDLGQQHSQMVALLTKLVNKS
jgi:chromosome segregation ATPase